MTLMSIGRSIKARKSDAKVSLISDFQVILALQISHFVKIIIEKVVTIEK